MPFPTILGVRHSHVTPDATSITILLPDGSNVSGYLVILCVTKDAPGAMTWPAGWTQLDEGNDLSNSSRTACRYRILNGTEGFDGVDDSISVSAAVAEEWAASAITISAWHGTTAPELAVAAAEIPDDADPPLLDPAAWGTESTLWIVYAGVDGPNAITGWPTNYTDNQHGDRTSVGGGAVAHGFATRTNAVASENPGAFTHPDADTRAYTIAVRPGINTQLLAATLASVLAVAPLLSIFRAFAGILISVPDVIAQRIIILTLLAMTTTIGLLTRVPSKLIAATMLTTGLLTNALIKVLAATMAGTGLLQALKRLAQDRQTKWIPRFLIRMDWP